MIETYDKRADRPLTRRAAIVNARVCGVSAASCDIQPATVNNLLTALTNTTGSSRRDEMAERCSSSLRGNAYVTLSRSEYISRELRNKFNHLLTPAAWDAIATRFSFALARDKTFEEAVQTAFSATSGLSHEEQAMIFQQLQAVNTFFGRLNQIEDHAIHRYAALIAERRAYGKSAAMSAKRAAGLPMGNSRSEWDNEEAAEEEQAEAELKSDAAGAAAETSGRQTGAAGSFGDLLTREKDEYDDDDDDVPAMAARARRDTGSVAGVLRLGDGASTSWRRPSAEVAAAELHPPFPPRLARYVGIGKPPSKKRQAPFRLACFFLFFFSTLSLNPTRDSILSATESCPLMDDAFTNVSNPEIYPAKLSQNPPRLAQNVTFRFLHIPKVGKSRVLLSFYDKDMPQSLLLFHLSTLVW